MNWIKALSPLRSASALQISVAGYAGSLMQTSTLTKSWVGVITSAQPNNSLEEAA